jgi:type I restriction enzyme M protein
MLSVTKEHLLDRAATPAQKEQVEKYVTVRGQEISRTNYAICQADLLIKNDRQAKVFLGNSLILHDEHSREPGDQLPESKFRFDFILSNPPFGVTWGGKDGYEKEARKLQKTRYQAGMPRVNDGALLFLETMLAKMQPPEKGGSRIAIIFNGSPLSNGDCGSDESEIRRWILENDWLDAVVMLPDQFEKEPKSFGNKRNRMTDAHRQWIEERYRKRPVHPREVFADALTDRASGVIVAHNRPSGQLEPSPGDVNITAQLKAAGAIVGVELLDHIIFNRSGYFSFLEDGRL